MNFLSLDIYAGEYVDFLETIKNPRKKTLVFTPNPEILVRASWDNEFLNILKQADRLTPDGAGLYVGTMMQEGKWFFSACLSLFFKRKQVQEEYGELIKWSDLTKNLVECAEKNQKKILIIDNYRITEPKNPFEIIKKEIQTHMNALLKEKYPNLSAQIFFLGDMSADGIAHHIELTKIDYVFACSGMKSQEQILIDVFSYLPDSFPVVGLGVGSSFDYLLGLQKRAPIFLQKLGLEWLYRLALDPRKRWRRIWTAVVEFPRMIKNLQK